MNNTYSIYFKQVFICLSQTSKQSSFVNTGDCKLKLVALKVNIEKKHISFIFYYYTLSKYDTYTIITWLFLKIFDLFQFYMNTSWVPILEQVMTMYEMGPLRAFFLVDGSTDHNIYYIIDPKVFDLEYYCLVSKFKLSPADFHFSI